MNFAKHKLLACCWATLIIACGASPEPMPAVPTVIAPPSDATISAAQREGANLGVTYMLDRVYPADGFIADLNERLGKAGFKPLSYDWLDPKVPTNQPAEWHSYVDGTVTPNVWAHQWLAQWQDGDGNVVAYVLRYRSAYTPSRGSYRDVPDNSRLQVSATYISAGADGKLKNESSERVPSNESIRDK